MESRDNEQKKLKPGQSNKPGSSGSASSGGSRSGPRGPATSTPRKGGEGDDGSDKTVAKLLREAIDRS